MKTGVILIIAGIIMYFLNTRLIWYFINKYKPGLFEDDTQSVMPDDNENAWEKTAGTGIVPKWVSFIGLLSIPSFFIGIIVLIISLVF